MEKIDRFRDKPSSIEKDSVLAHNYNFLAEAYSGGKDTLARLYIDSLEYLAKDSRWSKAKGLYLRAYGKYYDRRGEFEKALDYYSRAMDAFQAAGDKSDYLVYTGILKGFVLSNNGLWQECLETLREIQPVAETLKNKNLLAYIYDYYGDYHFYSAFGVMDYEEALEYYKRVEQLLPEITLDQIKADNAHGLAGCYLRLGDTAKALEYKEKALELARESGNHSVIFAVYGDLADVYEERGEYDEAIAHRELSLEYARQTDWIEMVSRAQRNIAITYKKAGDYKNALKHFEELQVIEDSISRFKVQTHYNELEARYESDRKDLEIQKLKASNLVLSRNVLIFFLACGICFLLYYRAVNKKLRRQNIALASKNREIQAALTEGQNLERKRMAVDLHDNINAKIAATKWMLETLQENQSTEQEKAFVGRLVASISDIYEDVRLMSHNLVPKDIEVLSLKEITHQLISRLNQTQKIQFDLKVTGECPNLDESTKYHTYSILLELLQNVIRHSEGTESTVRMDCNREEDRLIIEVSDNGRGFDADQISQGTGLNNIRSRTASINGEMEIAEMNGEGSRITVKIPFHKVVS